MKRLALLLLGVALLPACQPGLSRQPRLGPLAHSRFFPDGAAARPLPAGVVGLQRKASASLSPLAELERGQERYKIHCSTCHGLTGEGGIALARGFSGIPSLVSGAAPALTDEEVTAWIAQGRGRMYGLGGRLPSADIRAITSYLRALQLSQAAPLSALSPEERTRLEQR